MTSARWGEISNAIGTTSVRIELNDLVHEIESTAEGTESNPHRLDQLNALHHELQRVLHKHHASDAGELQRLEQSLTEQLTEAAGIDEATAAKDALKLNAKKRGLRAMP